MKIILVLMDILLGLRILTGVSKHDWGGYGTFLYGAAIIGSLLYFLIRAYRSYRKGNPKDFVFCLASIFAVGAGIPAAAFLLLLILNYFPK